MTRLGVVTLLMVIAMPSVAQQPAKTATASPSFSWPEAGTGCLLEVLVSKVDVQNFLTAVYESWDLPPVTVGQYGFAALSPGRPSLLATVDASGRGLFYSLAIANWDGSKVSVTVVEAHPPYDLPASVVDLDGDGLCEVISQELAGGYEGVRTKPIMWKKVLKSAASHSLSDVSLQNRWYFEQEVFPSLDALEAKLTALPDIGVLESEEIIAEFAFVRAKYRRALSGDASAGLDLGLQWAGSGNPKLQDLAVKTLADVPGRKARQALEQLAASPHLNISSAAKAARHSNPERIK
jgi:hypothetical protein